MFTGIPVWFIPICFLGLFCFLFLYSGFHGFPCVAPPTSVLAPRQHAFLQGRTLSLRLGSQSAALRFCALHSWHHKFSLSQVAQFGIPKRRCHLTLARTLCVSFWRITMLINLQLVVCESFGCADREGTARMHSITNQLASCP